MAGKYIEKELNKTILPDELKKIIYDYIFYPKKYFKEMLKMRKFFKKIFNIECEETYDTWKYLLDKIMCQDPTKDNYDSFERYFLDYKVNCTKVIDCFRIKDGEILYIDIVNSGERKNKDKVFLKGIYTELYLTRKFNRLSLNSSTEN